MSAPIPGGFLWGTATAAHQVEGGNWNSDWWEWEHRPDTPCVEVSGDACDHYHRYRDDLSMLADLGFNSYRFSIEWARIEPEENEFSRAALDHYKRMCGSCRDLGLRPVVTFHHFTSPRWVAAKGSWNDPGIVDAFVRFCDVAARHLGDEIAVACTINEPNIVALFGYQVGIFPPGTNDPDARLRANDNFIAAHRKATDAIKAHTTAPVGLTLAMSEYQAVDGGQDYLEQLQRPMEDVFLEAIAGDDFVGVQTYSRYRVGPKGLLGTEEGVEITQMGYEFYPRALEHTIERAARLSGCPVIVTENGIATADDSRRIAFIEAALDSVRATLKAGVDLRGYFYWSFLDNFEWNLGYAPTFGLVAVDRTTQVRTIKPSARWLGEIVRSGALPEA
ncbi:MAG: glycoside hydrolase family 1 protein [Actinomycetota bacterium]